MSTQELADGNTAKRWGNHGSKNGCPNGCPSTIDLADLAAVMGKQLNTDELGAFVASLTAEVAQ
ncbi:hypothetical protein [Rosistilla ulvae]|nr:hypothetical protein [Rosistilla ulvae]